MSTFREKYNIKHGFRKNASHSIDDIAKTTKIKKSILQQAYNRGIGAAKSNFESVRNKETGKKTGVIFHCGAPPTTVIFFIKKINFG